MCLGRAPFPAANGPHLEAELSAGIAGYNITRDTHSPLARPDMSSLLEASGRSRIVPKTERLTRSSRWLHKIDHYTCQPWTTVFLGAILVLAVVLGALLGFP